MFDVRINMETAIGVGLAAVLVTGATAVAQEQELLVVVHDRTLLKEAQKFAEAKLRAADGTDNPSLRFLATRAPTVVHSEAKGIEAFSGKATMILDISISHKATDLVRVGPVVHEHVIRGKNFRYSELKVDPRDAKHYRVQWFARVVLYDGVTGEKIISRHETINTTAHSFAAKPSLDDLRPQTDRSLLALVCHSIRADVADAVIDSVKYQISGNAIVAHVSLKNQFPVHVSAKLLFNAAQQTFAKEEIMLRAGEDRQLEVVVARDLARNKLRGAVREAKDMLRPELVDLQLGNASR